MYLILKKGRNTSKASIELNADHTIRFNILMHPTEEVQTPMLENVDFFIFCQNKDHGCAFTFIMFFLCFPLGWSYRTDDPRRLWEGLFDRKSKVLVSFLSDQKDWKAVSPPSTPYFLQSHLIKILR